MQLLLALFLVWGVMMFFSGWPTEPPLQKAERLQQEHEDARKRWASMTSAEKTMGIILAAGTGFFVLAGLFGLFRPY